MQFSQLACRLACGALCLSFLSFSFPACVARAVDPVKKEAFEKAKFFTADHVELMGRFYPSFKGKKAPSVICLHKIGSDSSKDGWDKLAESLQKKGYAVLVFDFRGHGDST